MTTITLDQLKSEPKPPGAGYEMTIERLFEAPRELVFDCFTDPKHLAAWWGPLGSSNEIKALDVRPGGQISLRMMGPSFDHVMGGEYVEIERPRRLVFLTKAFEAPGGGWGIVNRNTITFEEAGGATRMVLHTLVERAEGDLVQGALGGMKAGWGQSLERLGDLVGGGGKTDVEVADRKILLRRAFDVPRETLWSYLVDPYLMMKWWIAGGGEVEVMDVRPGGEWKVRATHGDGQSHLFWGKFVEIEPPGRMVMTQGFDAYADTPVEIILTEEWGRTVLTRIMNFPDNSYRDGMMGSGYARHCALSFDLLAAAAAG
jgi:uncharacterized protein YndB with AHSA1/START domain